MLRNSVRTTKKGNFSSSKRKKRQTKNKRGYHLRYSNGADENRTWNRICSLSDEQSNAMNILVKILSKPNAKKTAPKRNHLKKGILINIFINCALFRTRLALKHSEKVNERNTIQTETSPTNLLLLSRFLIFFRCCSSSFSSSELT